MAQTQTLLQLRTRAYQKADMQRLTDFMPNAEVDGYINQAIAEFHDLICESQDDLYYEERVTFNAVSGKEEYSIGAGADIDTTSTGEFYRLVAMNVTEGSQVYDLHPYNRHDRSMLLNAGNYSPWRKYQYRMRKTSVSILPIPTGTQVIVFSYIPVAVTLVSDGDTFDDIQNWAEYIVIRTAIHMLFKEQSDTAELKEELDFQKTRIRSAYTNRQTGLPDSITDATSNEDYLL